LLNGSAKGEVFSRAVGGVDSGCEAAVGGKAHRDVVFWDVEPAPGGDKAVHGNAIESFGNIIADDVEWKLALDGPVEHVAKDGNRRCGSSTHLTGKVVPLEASVKMQSSS